MQQRAFRATVNASGRVIAMAFLALVLGLTLPARAADRDKLVAFLQVTGFDVALDSIALAAEDAPMMLGMRAKEFGYQWKSAAEEVFDSTLMRGMAVDILEKTLNDALLNHAAAFYATPLGLRLVEVENASHMAEDEPKRAEGERLLAEITETDPERLAQIKRMNDAIDGAGLAVRAVQEIQLRFLMAAGQAGVIGRTFDENELRELLSQDEDKMRESMQASAMANSAWTYRDFSTEEIETYAAALEDERMQQVYDLMNAIQWEIMANRFEALAVRMAGMTRGEEL
ncbi:DUF2059 domain-containing protein [Marimonas arenosa]|uniref:DUF2059 domain-containing protein n=1 Tax=Marimonas arenosa TaxID=1795305 RepID=A0AAE3W9H6_9RHOB|nr:DUF2059 domain-containing protein [Marimonas arenosa]MDQ2088689.1 DUF2059 domain-containing protein [Marimonas arenosa]